MARAYGALCVLGSLAVGPSLGLPLLLLCVSWPLERVEERRERPEQAQPDQKRRRRGDPH
jgi:hypothetical protein